MRAGDGVDMETGNTRAQAAVGSPGEIGTGTGPPKVTAAQGMTICRYRYTHYIHMMTTTADIDIQTYFA
jgi:hypothetical protein